MAGNNRKGKVKRSTGNLTPRQLKTTRAIDLASTTSGEITKTIFPNNIQVGVNTKDFPSSIISMGIITAKGGFSGSLTTLADGTPYLIAGSNVTLTTGSNGQITIASTGGGGGGAGDGDKNAKYLVLQATGSLTAERVLTAGTGLTASDAGPGNAWTLAIDDGIVATLTGSIFSGPVAILDDIFLSGSVSDFTATGSVKFNSGLSGSLTQLVDGSSYLIAGSNITISSASNGAVTITNADGGGSDVGWTGPSAGQIDTTGSLGVTGSVDVGEYIRHIGDDDTYIRFTDDNVYFFAGAREMIFLKEDGTQDGVIINDAGEDVDFRVESTGEPRALFVDANANSFHINYNESNFDTKIHNTNDIAITVNSSGVILNDDAHATNDFRVESSGEDEAIFLDSSANTLYVNKGATSFTTVIKNNHEEAIRVGASGVIINEYAHATNDFRVESSGHTHALFIDAENDEILLGASSMPGNDAFLFVSGTIGSRGTTVSGSAVFGGDTIISGALYVSTPGTGQDVIFYGEDSDAIGLQWDADANEHGKLTLGQNDHGVDFQVYGETAGKYLRWDQSADTFYLWGSLNTRYDQVFDGSSQGWDFTVNSNSRVGIFVDGDQDQVYILSGGSGTGPTSPNPANAADLAFFVSGSIGSKNSSVKGAAIFGGDVVVSGSVTTLAGFSGSLTHLLDGTSYIIGGGGVSVTTQSNGSLIISASGGASLDHPFITYEADSSLTYERVLTASSGIAIITSSAGLVSVKSDPFKVMYDVTGSHTKEVPLVIAGVDFSVNSFDPNKNNIYLNGQLLMSGTNRDYTLTTANSLTFNFLIEDEDVVLILQS